MDQHSQQMQYLATRFGGPAEITTIVQRLAAIFKVPEEDYTLYADVRGALYTASQWMWQYGATPIRHIHLIPFNRRDTRPGPNNKPVTFWRTTYAVADSYEWRRASAEIITAERHLRWTLQTAAIPDEKLEALMKRYGLISTVLGGPYNVEDIGYHARAFFFNQADECKQYNQPYDPA